MKQLPTNRNDMYMVVFFGLLNAFVLSAVTATAFDMWVMDIGHYKEGFVFLVMFSYLIHIFIRINSDGENE